LDFVFFVDDIIMGVCLCIFGWRHRALDANTKNHFWHEYLLETRLSYESL